MITQLKLLKNKLLRTQKFKGNIFEKVGTLFNEFYHHKLPFELTNAQKRVLKEIRQDTQRGVQMNRLLQGDVGSGKTVVAFWGCVVAMKNNKQAAIMAPTEILAQQHFFNFQKLLGQGAFKGLKVVLLISSTKAKEKKEISHKKMEQTCQKWQRYLKLKVLHVKTDKISRYKAEDRRQERGKMMATSVLPK